MLLSSRGPELETSSRRALGCSASFPLPLSILGKTEGCRHFDFRHLSFSPGRNLAQRISFIPWTCLSCGKQLGIGPEKTNSRGGGGERQQTGFSTLVNGLNTGCMGPLTPTPAPAQPVTPFFFFRLHPPSPFCSQGRQEVLKLLSLSCPRCIILRVKIELEEF